MNRPTFRPSESLSASSTADRRSKSRWTQALRFALVRIGGEDRVPKIPLLVGEDLLDRYGDYR